MPVLNITIPTVLGDLSLVANQRTIDRVTKTIEKTPNLLNKAYELVGNQYAQRIAKMAKRCISRGMPPPGSGVSWQPHAESTVRRLGEHGLLYWSSQYYHNIQVIKRGKHISVGVPSNVRKTRPDHYKRNNSSVRTLSQVAKILEYGSLDGRIPARPLWRYIWKSVNGPIGYKKDLIQEINRQVRKSLKN